MGWGYNAAMSRDPLPKKPKHTPRYAAVAILRKLQEYGHEAYLAGGCVRDALLGLEPKDFDVATDADPDRVRMLFDRSWYVGEAFGVVRVRMMGHDIEVATFRQEWGYQDGRRPDKVKFSDAEHDAQRRDFTINGLFENPLIKNKDERIIDYVGGREDMQRRVLRAIGDPAERFGEDYLRMLRAVRFAARLGFTIEPGTLNAIGPLAENLGKISRERIGQEVLMMLSVKHAARRTTAIATLQQTNLDTPVLTEDHVEAASPTVASLPDEVDYATVLAAWLLDRHRPYALQVFVDEQLEQIVIRWRDALCLSNDDRDGLKHVIVLAAKGAAWEQLGRAARKRLLADASWDEALALLRAMRHAVDGPGLPGGGSGAGWPGVPGSAPGHPGAAEAVAAIERDAPGLYEDGVSPSPFITGDELIALGRKPGPAFGRLLEAVYDAQLDGSVRSREQALEWIEQEHGSGHGS